ncbi:MAG: helix-turn-helix domain-containing protein [Cyanobacteriota bacterium]|nr:helix-turn-helix domain-containing protein [Cyanobacteriota bacterium]
MAPAKLTDNQKQELVQRFREGENTQLLADYFGCSSTTVTRMVRAELGHEAYGALRDERLRKGSRDKQIPLAIDSSPASPLENSPPEGAAAEMDQVDLEPEADLGPEPLELAEGAQPEAPEAPVPADSGNTVLAIDDADDFGDDDGEDDLLSAEEDDDEGFQDSGEFHAVAVLPIAVDDQREIQAAPWSPAVLPPCAYLLVDKTVELQARPLADMPELGLLPTDEQDRQALVLFTNPRQAKRHCGRTQRVIKLPDPALLGRTAPYLQAQGISRVVIEGALYALPEV